MNIYIGNLSSQVHEEDLTRLFSAFGNVSRVNIMKDSYTGLSRGFGFVEMTGKPEQAIKELDKKDLKGKVISVSEARSKDNRSSGSRSRRTTSVFGNRTNRY